MKNHILPLIMILFLMGSCHYPSYLEQFASFERSPYGGYITAKLTNSQVAFGELVAVDSVAIYVLEDTVMKASSNYKMYQVDSLYNNEFARIEKTLLRTYTVHFAKPQSFALSIPLLSASTYFHGYYSIFTLPLNLIGTLFLTANNNQGHFFTNKKLQTNELYKFARYPQGFSSTAR